MCGIISNNYIRRSWRTSFEFYYNTKISISSTGRIDQQKRIIEKFFIFQQNYGLDNVFQRPNDDAQLQAAYELQLWKESKELEFEKHVCIHFRKFD